MEGLLDRGKNGKSARVDRLPIEDDNSTPVMIFLIVAGPVFCEPVCSFYRRAEHTQLSVMCGNDRAFFWRDSDVLAQFRDGGRRGTPPRDNLGWANLPAKSFLIDKFDFKLRDKS